MDQPRTWIDRSRRISRALAGLEVLGSILILCGVLVVLDPIVGRPSRMMAVWVVLYWGLRRGMIGGMTAAVVWVLLVQPAITFLAGFEPVPIVTTPFALGLLTAVGAAIGRMSDLSKRLKRELAARKLAEVRLLEEQEGFLIFFEGNPHSMWIFHEETLAFLKVNRTMAEVYGYSMEELGRMSLKDIQLPENIPTLRTFLSEAIPERNRVVIFERRHRKKDGSTLEVEILTQKITYQGRPARLGMATDVTDQNRKRAALEHEANHDVLTGLPNRASFGRSLARVLERAIHDGGTFSVFLMDLDRFKEINDTMGHSYGDLVLQQVGPRLLAALRQGDILARLGGDEFGLLLPGANAATANRVGDRLLAAFEPPFVFEGRSFDVGTSIGIVTYPDHVASDPATLLNLADLAMYAAKRERGGAVAYDSDLKGGSTRPTETEERPMILPYPDRKAGRGPACPGGGGDSTRAGPSGT